MAAHPRKGEFGWVPPGGVKLLGPSKAEFSPRGERSVIAIDFGTARSSIATLAEKSNESSKPWVQSIPADSLVRGASLDTKVETCLIFSGPDALGSSSHPLTLDSPHVGTLAGDRWVMIGPTALETAEEHVTTHLGQTAYYVRDFKMELDLQTKRTKGLSTDLKSVKLKATPLHPGGAPIMVDLTSVLNAYVAAAAKVGLEALMRFTETLPNFTKPKREDIHWVLTIPAIWVDQARIFMRQVAYDSGMAADVFTNKVGICLEPEGALLEAVRDDRLGSYLRLKGKTVLILDWGGGTVDITFSRITSISEHHIEFEEMAPPLGGPFGGRRFNQELERLVFQPWLGSSYQKWVDEGHRDRFFRHFIEPKKVGVPQVPLPWQLNMRDIFDTEPVQVSVDTLASRVSAVNATLAPEHHLVVGQLRGKRWYQIPAALISHCFNICIDPVLALIDQPSPAILRSSEPPEAVFIVGGMGQNQYLINYVTEKLPGRRIIDPTYASMAIALGATRFGLDSGAFGSRRARTNYGMELLGRKWGPLVPKGTLLSKVSRLVLNEGQPYRPPEATTTHLRISIYECEDTLEPSAPLTDKCYWITEIILDVNMSVPFEDRRYEIQLSMDQTVIKGMIVDLSNQHSTLIKWGSR